jgi:hypothetical protein
VVDRLAALALDRGTATPLRLAALRALHTLDAATIAPVQAALKADPDDTIRAEANQAATPAGDADPLALLINAADIRLPDDASALWQAVRRAAATVPLPLLLGLVERVRAREKADPAAAAGWTIARGAVHLALATRGSRIALYDLRESLEDSPTPLPVAFLAALAMIGDARCLESIAAAHVKAGDAWWREHLADAFRTIVKREALTKRSPAVKKIEKRWPQALLDLWPHKAR